LVKTHHTVSIGSKFMMEYDIFSENNYGLYEDNTVSVLDPLFSPFRYKLFNDPFWDLELTDEEITTED